MIKSLEYVERLDGVTLQFEFIRYCLGSLAKNRKLAFFKDKRVTEIAKNEEIFGPLPIEEETKAMLKKFFSKDIRKKYRPANLYFYHQFSSDSLNQSELLLLVAHFESFMKEVHEEILLADPKLIAVASPGRRISLEDIFKSGYQNFTKGEAKRETKALDKESISVRAQYFQKKLDIKMGDEKAISLLKEIMRLRNKISHEISNESDKIVSDEFLIQARKVLREVPSHCCWEAAKRYPTRFK